MARLFSTSGGRSCVAVDIHPSWRRRPMRAARGSSPGAAPQGPRGAQFPEQASRSRCHRVVLRSSSRRVTSAAGWDRGSGKSGEEEPFEVAAGL